MYIWDIFLAHQIIIRLFTFRSTNWNSFYTYTNQKDYTLFEWIFKVDHIIGKCKRQTIWSIIESTDKLHTTTCVDT